MIDAAIMVPGEISWLHGKPRAQTENAGLKHEPERARHGRDHATPVRRGHLLGQCLVLQLRPTAAQHGSHSKGSGHFGISPGFFSGSIGPAHDLAGLRTRLVGHQIVDHRKHSEKATATIDATPSTGCMR
jgi:hypothetical protein